MPKNNFIVFEEGHRFFCSVCGKNRHLDDLEIKTDEVDGRVYNTCYICKYCDWGKFIIDSCLGVDQRGLNTGGIPQTCDGCEELFKSGNKLHQHLREFPDHSR